MKTLQVKFRTIEFFKSFSQNIVHLAMTVNFTDFTAIFQISSEKFYSLLYCEKLSSNLKIPKSDHVMINSQEKYRQILQEEMLFSYFIIPPFVLVGLTFD